MHRLLSLRLRGWIKKNPIPPDQARWDVYSKLNEDNERFLWGILVEASKPSASRNLVETEIGDYFAACMDEPAVEKAGIAPLKPELDAIAGCIRLRDLPAYLGRQHLAIAGDGMLFGFGSSQDYEDSSRVIAFANAGGLGLPDRDYYTKTDAKSQETRQKYVEHVQQMFELLGEAPAAAKAHAQTVMDIETELAKASLDAGGQARSLQAVSQDDSRAVAGADAVLPLGGLLRNQPRRRTRR